MSIRSSLFVPWPLTNDQITNVRQLIADMKEGKASIWDMYSRDLLAYGLVYNAFVLMVRKYFRGMSRKDMGAWLEAEFETLEEVANSQSTASVTKRPNSFTFRKLTKERIANARQLIKELSEGRVWIPSELARLDYGLTSLAIKRLEKFAKRHDSMGKAARWLSSELSKAIAEQEAVAHRPGRGGRYVRWD